VLLVSATVLTFVWAATEWTAWKLGFQSGHGHTWFEVFALRVPVDREHRFRLIVNAHPNEFHQRYQSLVADYVGSQLGAD
jgi:hypothetical protein